MNPDLDESNTPWHILIAGLPRVSNELTLASGITLQPLNQPLSVFDLAAAGAAGFRSWALLEPLASACTCELAIAPTAAPSAGYNTLNRGWLASSLLVLRGFTKHLSLACSSYSWNQIAGHQQRTAGTADGNLPKFVGNVLDFHLNIVVNSDARVDSISPDDIQWISDRFDTFNKMAANSDSFRFALESSIDWRFTKDGRSAIARLWSGIEAIFGISSELVYRISLLAASLLAPRGTQRREKFQEIKKLYGLRSKAVHGSKLSDAKMAEAVNGSFRLLADLLILAIERGHPLTQDDFDKAVFD
ncbi:hypothetical protein EC9_26830 [Rosistilla ulvae]|uniref:Uncharacterized protein n=1 Tax=Rosistilla ulvae TaxID=1930277 RepID=A0A517M0U4_9BACT|nr:HEPN domain-containing protein [Rosistilla ulvae]QDS88492.1 hypothetical protein EC9_26830 [Rosistilla ulvae]